MSNANFQDFSGNISEIGPMYPFVGWEWLFVIVCVVFWLGWHVRQIRIENREFKEESAKYVNQEILDRVYEREEADPGV